ncbi:MAG TPA: signal peptidase II [Gammaproteobacteria bacterium]|nr:signal peptidase II [Gammaproteobacteria bacterium]
MTVKWLWITVVVLLLDQGTKLLADSSMALYDPIELLPSLALTKAYNTGAAFSFLGDASGWQRWFFSGLAVVVCGVLLVWLRRLHAREWRTALALTLILGGAIGNLIDRLLYGHVIDFIDVYYKTWHWPTFNVADSAISIGAALLVLDALFSHRHTPSGA